MTKSNLVALLLLSAFVIDRVIAATYFVADYLAATKEVGEEAAARLKGHQRKLAYVIISGGLPPRRWPPCRACAS
jgi:hypothetical protein